MASEYIRLDSVLKELSLTPTPEFRRAVGLAWQIQRHRAEAGDARAPDDAVSRTSLLYASGVEDTEIPELLADVVPRQVANAHSIFNVAVALLFLPFTVPFARLINRMVPDRPVAEEEAIIKSKYLDRILLMTPALSLNAVRHELRREGMDVDRRARLPCGCT